jgi:hypothetical protein
MATCEAYLRTQTLYRGQEREYPAVLSSGWRKLWSAHQMLGEKLGPLGERFATARIGGGLRLAWSLARLAASAEDGPTLHRFLQEKVGPDLIGGQLGHVRQTFGPRWRGAVARSQLAQIEAAFLSRYQAYVFNEAEDDFMRRFVPRTLVELGGLLLRFYDAHRGTFDVERRIGQVAIDFMGILQHYGVVGTPGLDLTSDLDVALWFATHTYKQSERRYEQLPPAKWGVIYEAHATTVVWSEHPVPGTTRANALPEIAVVNLSNLSPKLIRLVRQCGWFAIPGFSWERPIDYARALHMKKARAKDYGEPNVILNRLASGGRTAESLFPGVKEDPFKAHLDQHDIETFM